MRQYLDIKERYPDAIVLFLASRVWVARIPLGGARPEPVPEAAG